MNPERACIHCGKLFTGRADKIFCSNTCKKAQHSTRVAALLPPPEIPAAPSVPPALVSPAPAIIPPLVKRTPRQEREYQQAEHRHVERLKQMEHDEQERQRLHQRQQLEQPWLEERRELVEIILGHIRQCRQWSGQSTDKVPPVDAIKSLSDLKPFVRLPLPQPLPPPVAPLPVLPAKLIVNAKVLFTRFIKQPTDEWTQSELSKARTALTKLISEVSQWQLENPTVVLGEEPVYTLGQALESVIATHLAASKKRFSLWEDPTIELQVGRSLASRLKQFIHD